MRAVPYALLFLLWCSTLTGCALFRSRSDSAGGGNNGLFSSTKENKAPRTTSPNDPLAAGPSLPAGNDGTYYSQDTTLLAGQLVDQYNTPLPNGYIRWTRLDDSQGKAAPIDVSVDRKGYFTIHGVKRGKRYKLEARAKQNGKLIAAVHYTTAPNIKLVIRLSKNKVTQNTPPIPNVPDIPKSPFGQSDNGEATRPDDLSADDKKDLTFGQPSPLANEATPGNSNPADWTNPLEPRSQPKYPKNIAGGAPFGNNPPLANIPSGAGNKKPSELPPPPPEYDGPDAEKRPLAVAPSVPLGAESDTHVPSCLLVGDKLKNLALPDFYGKTWEWNVHRRGKLVLLDFWATHCPPCLAAIPHLRILQQKYGPDGLEIIGIAAESRGTIEEQRYRVAGLCQAKQTNYRILMATGADDPVLNQFKVRGLPTMILLDGDGNVLWRHSGPLDGNGWEALERFIQMRLEL